MIFTVTLNPAIDKTVEINPFTPGAVNRVSAMRLDAGGKGINVSKVIQSLGGRSCAVGLLAGRSGQFVKEYLDSLGIANAFCYIEGETRTNLKITDSVNQINTDINEPGPFVKEQAIQEIEKRLLEKVRDKDIVIFSGSVPVGVDTHIYGLWINLCSKLGAKTILDADGELLKHGIKAGPYLVKPNIHELERFTGKTLTSISEVEQAGRGLLQDFGIERVVVSMGERGALFIDNQHSYMAEAIKVDVKSTVGAGDAMVAALALSIEKMDPLDKAIQLAMASGIANVMTSGSQSADLSVIKELEGMIRFRCIQ